MVESVVTCQRMKELEKLTDEKGLSYYQMMENAGTCAYAAIMSEAGVHIGHRAIVFCGKGNNGGDGLVVARKLCETGLIVTVVLVDGMPKTEDAIKNYELLQNLPVQILDMTTSFDVSVALLKNEDNLDDESTVPDVIVDAIYGTGFHGELRPGAATAAAYISKYSDRAFALDIPSGLSGDMKEGDSISKGSARVRTTITFHAKKPVHLVPEAREYCGQVEVVNIGIVDE